jgi:hypothetical protein
MSVLSLVAVFYHAVIGVAHAVINVAVPPIIWA